MIIKTFSVILKISIKGNCQWFFGGWIRKINKRVPVLGGYKENEKIFETYSTGYQRLARKDVGEVK